MSVATALRTVEWLHFQGANVRGDYMRQALLKSHGQSWALHQTTTYTGTSDVLMLWGPGAPNRFEPMQQHVKRGGHVVAWDLAYWQRDLKVRCSIDSAHPQQWVMKRDWPLSRLMQDGIQVKDRWNPEGPVIVAGIGVKAKVQYGPVVDQWEADITAACEDRGWTVQYRDKAGATVPIDRVLDGASMLVTWHSNVAVDAIRLGIPVVCRDGAAAAVCPSTIPATPRPLPADVRNRFLGNLAWFQWGTTQDEARLCWQFLSDLL